MLDIRFIRENTDVVKQAALDKGVKVDIDRLLKVDEERRSRISLRDELRAKQNKVSQEISIEKDQALRDEKIAEMQHLKKDLKDIEEHLEGLETEYHDLMYAVPNIPYPEVPRGKDEKSNVVLREVGKRTEFDFEAKDYLTIAESHQWIDMARAAKIAGSRFAYIRGELALLEFAIIQYTLNRLVKEGFTPVVPPVMVKPEYMNAMGFLHGEAKDDVYFLEQDQLYLVGTSEQSIGPMHADETLDINSLPRRYAGFSTCFRREAGSYGRDTHGILRVHQFDKVEMISFTDPKKSREEHKYLLSLNESMMQDLGLPYRILHMATGDMSLPKAEQFDVETWIPSEKCYRETHSASNITDFQARRLNVRTKMEDGTIQFVHMLNDTAFAIPRMLIAIIENGQQKDGSVRVPKALKEYLGKDRIPFS